MKKKTVKAWAVVNMASGNIIWGDTDTDTRLPLYNVKHKAEKEVDRVKKLSRAERKVVKVQIVYNPTPKTEIVRGYHSSLDLPANPGIE